MIGDILQPTHLLFVLVVALLVLGPKRLPEAGRALGRGLRDFRSAVSGEDERPEAILPGAAPAVPAPAPPVTVAAPPVPAVPAESVEAVQQTQPAQPPAGHIS